MVPPRKPTVDIIDWLLIPTTTPVTACLPPQPSITTRNLPSWTKFYFSVNTWPLSLHDAYSTELGRAPTRLRIINSITPEFIPQANLFVIFLVSCISTDDWLLWDIEILRSPYILWRRWFCLDFSLLCANWSTSRHGGRHLGLLPGQKTQKANSKLILEPISFRCFSHHVFSWR